MLLATAEGETPRDLGFPEKFVDSEGIEYKIVVSPNSNKIISV